LYFCPVGTDSFDVVANVTNTKSYEWTIPTNISEDVLKSTASIGLFNGITETQSLVTEQFRILPKQPDSPLPQKKSKLGKFTSSGLAAGKTSMRENTPLTITWDSPAEYVKLTFGVSGNPYRPLFPLFGM
jgi:hypothetical protein